MALPKNVKPNTGLSTGKPAQITSVTVRFATGKTQSYKVTSVDLADSPMVVVNGKWYEHLEGRVTENDVDTGIADALDLITVGSVLWVRTPAGFRKRGSSSWGAVTTTDPRT